MRKLITLPKVAAAAASALALTMMASPAAAQSYGYGSGSDPVLGAILRGVAGVVLNNGSQYGNSQYGYGQYGNGTYRGENCEYYRDGRCYRNLGHWERDNGINSRDYNNRYGSAGAYGSYDPRYGTYDTRYENGRYYEGRGYYRDGRWYRNYGQWRSAQNRAYRYNRGW